MNKTLFLLFIFMLVPVGLAEAQVGTPDSSGADLNLSIAPVSQSYQSDDIVTLTASATSDNPLTFSWSQTDGDAPAVMLQNADSSTASFRVPYIVRELATTLAFSVNVTDGDNNAGKTIDVPVTLTTKSPIVIPTREPTPGVEEMIFFEQQWDGTDGWVLSGQWNIQRSTDTLPVDTNNRILSIGECNGSCPLHFTDMVDLSTYDGADLVFWVWFGDQIASTDSLNLEVAATPDGTWENKHAIIVGQSTHQRWFQVTVNLDEFAGNDFFFRLTPLLEGDKSTIQIDAVQLIAKTMDDAKPVISEVPEDIVLDLLRPSVVPFTRPAAVDNLDGQIAVECNVPSGVIHPFGTTIVTCTTQDMAGNVASASFDITITKFIPLEITAPDGLTLEAEGVLTLVDLGTASINRNATVTNDAPGLFPLGTTIITWTARDDKGGIINDTQTILIQDTTDPVITAPGDVTLEATSLISMIHLGVATATDTVDAMPTITSNAPNSFPIGITIVTYTATDDSGNSVTATQTITINDTEPVLVLPSDVTVEATGAQTPVDIGTATVTDNIDTITATNDAPDSFPVGDTLVTWTATDISENTVTAIQTVTIRDTTDPYFDIPASNILFAEATGRFTTLEIGTVTAHDIADPDVAVTNDAPDSFPLAATFVTWTARDSSGNTARYDQIVVVSDKTSPTITAPDDVTIEADTLLTMIQLGVATATDLVDPMPTITSDAPTSFPIGVTIVTYTATDFFDNSATDIQKVTIQDTIEPMLFLPSDVTAEATGALTLVDIGTATVSDNIDTITATNDSPDSFPLGETRVTWTAMDISGNTATAIQTVVIRDTTNPTITVPHSLIVEATDELTPVYIGNATARDTVDPDVTVTHDAPDSFPLGETTITWSARDDSGNAVNNTQTVRIQDTTEPVFASFPDDITVTHVNRDAVEFETPTATDVFPVTILCSHDSGDSFPVGSTLVTCMATDANDNAIQDSFSVTVDAAMLESVTDDFANLDSWEFVKSIHSPPTWQGHARYNNYMLELSATDGNPAPSALITGYGFGADAGINRDISLENHDPDEPLYLSVDYRATSGSTHSTVTNALLQITDTDGNSLYKIFMVGGGTLDSGWRTFSTNVTQYVIGEDDITVQLYLADPWIYPWNKKTSFDNFYLGEDPLPSRSISGTDTQLTPLQELSLQISQYDQAQVCGLIESLDESADIYADTLELVRAYNMTTTC